MIILIFRSINFPLLYQYKFPVHKVIRPFFEVGLSYKLRTKNAYGGRNGNCGIVIGSPCYEYNYTEELVEGPKKNNVVMLVAAGTEIKWGIVSIPISIRLNEGIMAYTLKDPQRESKSFTDLKTRTIQILVGVNF